MLPFFKKCISRLQRLCVYVELQLGRLGKWLQFIASAYSFQSQLWDAHQGRESREAYWLIWSESKLEATQNS